MNKVEMLRKVSEVSGYTQKDVDAILAAYSNVVVDTLKENRKEKIALGSLGKFEVKHVSERKGTVMLGTSKGSEWVKPAHDEITFKISSSVKELV